MAFFTSTVISTQRSLKITSCNGIGFDRRRVPEFDERHRRNLVNFVSLRSQQLFTALLEASWLGDHRLRRLRELGGTIKIFSPILSVGAPTSYCLHQLRCPTLCKPRE